MRRGGRSKSPAERLQSSVAKLTARGRSCCGWLSEGVLRLDSLNAEQRWRDNGAARVLAGATGRHPAGVTGMRSPRGAACLTRSGAARGRRRQRADGLGRLSAAGPSAGRGSGRWARRQAGLACGAGPERRRRPSKKGNENFDFIFNEISNSSFQIPF